MFYVPRKTVSPGQNGLDQFLKEKGKGGSVLGGGGGGKGGGKRRREKGEGKGGGGREGIRVR